jgi:hypothetical protein
MKFNFTYPQNYIFRKPLHGAFIIFGFSIFFLWSYRPLEVERSMLFDFGGTVVIYSLIAALTAFLTIHIIRQIPFFSDERSWTIWKELLAAYLVMQAIGITIFLGGFVIEDSSTVSRWNFATFLDSSLHAFLIELIPFSFFTLMNFNRASKPKEDVNYHQQTSGKTDPVVNIESTLKKESLSFRISEFLFAESDGNYVVFHLSSGDEVRKTTIRNSISSIEQQVKSFPGVFRCHRAFIVNLDKVISKRGNSLGYLLRLKGADTKVPVSRSKVDDFNRKTEA